MQYLFTGRVWPAAKLFFSFFFFYKSENAKEILFKVELQTMKIQAGSSTCVRTRNQAFPSPRPWGQPPTRAPSRHPQHRYLPGSGLGPEGLGHILPRAPLVSGSVMISGIHWLP